MNIVSVLLTVALVISLNVKAESCIDVKVQGKGKPVILIPGLMSDGSVWSESYKYLAKSHEVHTVSIAGFGRTAACSFASNIIPQVKSELLDYVKFKQLNQPVLIGHSLGAFLSYSLAIEDSELFSAIIAVDGLPYVAPIFTRTAATTTKDMQQQADYIRKVYQGATSQQVADMTKQSISVQATSKQNQQKVIAMAKSSDQHTVASALHYLLTTDLREPLKKVNTPILLIAAQGAFVDEEGRQAASSLYQQQIENVVNAKLIVNSDVRHFIMWDDNDWLMKQADSFLQEVL